MYKQINFNRNIDISARARLDYFLYKSWRNASIKSNSSYIQVDYDEEKYVFMKHIFSTYFWKIFFQNFFFSLYWCLLIYVRNGKGEILSVIYFAIYHISIKWKKKKKIWKRKYINNFLKLLEKDIKYLLRNYYENKIFIT